MVDEKELNELARDVIKNPHDAVSYGRLCDAAGVREGRRAISPDERFAHASAF